MSDHVVQSNHDNDGMDGQSVRLYQSDWMAHWIHSSCKPESQGRDQYREVGNSKQAGPKIPPKISKSDKRIREFSESRTVNITSESLKLSSVKLGEERLESQSFSKLNLSQNRDNVMALRNVATDQGVVSEMAISSGGCDFQHEAFPGNLEQRGKSPDSLEKKSLAGSTSFKRDVCSSSKIVPHQNNDGKTPVWTFLWQKEEIGQPCHFVTSKKHRTNTEFPSYYTPLFPEKRMNNPLDIRGSGPSSSNRNNMSLLLHDPLASNDQVPVFVGKLYENPQNQYSTRSFPNWSIPINATKSQTLFHDFCTVPRIPPSLHDVETMRICTTVDSMEELSRRPPMLSQMAHQFLVTKTSGINLSEGGSTFNESTFSANLVGKFIRKFPSLSPDFGFHGQQGVKLQPLGSSTDSEGNGNLRDARTSAFCLKNESSAETDTMDMDVFHNDHFSGVVSFPTNKIMKGVQMSSTSQAAIASSKEQTGGRFPNTELPDMNNEVPAVPAVTSSADDRETSTSRTESLDVVHLLSHAELPRNSKSSAFPDGYVESDACNRWVKRLKLSASGSFAHGTESSKMEEASREKVSNFFGKIMKCSMTSSEPTMGKCSNKEQMALGQAAALLRNGESSTESVKKTQDVTRFYSWIRRWCHHNNVSPKQNHEALVVCEPQSSNTVLEVFRKKQLPSIAAMALVGRALNSFQPCEFRRRGTYIVWNS